MELPIHPLLTTQEAEKIADEYFERHQLGWSKLYNRLAALRGSGGELAAARYVRGSQRYIYDVLATFDETYPQ